MIRRMVLPLIFGLGVAAVLAGLGTWQMKRLAWKEGVLAEIEARIAAPAVALPETPEAGRDRYLPVTAEGRIGAPSIRVLMSLRNIGAGYRVISRFETGGRVVMIDRGFIRAAETIPEPPAGVVRVTGNLHWPDEVNSSTPEPDLEAEIWFARDVPAMAAALGAEPVLIVARDLSQTEAPLTPLPVDTAGIPNDHLAYAITWYSLAALWLGMTLYLLWRIRQRTI